jgi:hypothetical protein
LHPGEPFGFICTNGLLPILGGALWANAVAEKPIAARTSKTLIVISPFTFSPSLQAAHDIREQAEDPSRQLPTVPFRHLSRNKAAARLDYAMCATAADPPNKPRGNIWANRPPAQPLHFRSVVSRNKSQLLLGKSPINSFLGCDHRF